MYQPTITESVYEWAKDVYGLDLLSAEKMRWFDLSCLSDMSEIKLPTAREIKRIRTGNKMSQEVFADCLQVSLGTVNKWERGKAKPRGSARQLLHLVMDKRLQLHADYCGEADQDAACLPPIRLMTPNQIRDLRLTNQADFHIIAVCANVSESTVRRWEKGQCKPSGPSLRLLNLVAEVGIDYLVAHKNPAAPALTCAEQATTRKAA